jgi:hypothetical protein
MGQTPGGDFSLTCSSTGQYVYYLLTAGDNCYVSTDYGVTFTSKFLGLNKYWDKVVCSADGSKVYTFDRTATSYIGKSYDYGATWNNGVFGTYYKMFPNCIACSSLGDKVIVGCEGGNLWLSNNYGVNWTKLSNAGVKTWTAVAMNSTGQYIVAAEDTNKCYLSKDYGATWTKQFDKSIKTAWFSATNDIILSGSPLLRYDIPLKINNSSLSTTFARYISGNKAPPSNIIQQDGKDLSDIFLPYDGTSTKANPTNILSNGIDLCNIFQKA